MKIIDCSWYDLFCLNEENNNKTLEFLAIKYVWSLQCRWRSTIFLCYINPYIIFQRCYRGEIWFSHKSLHSKKDFNVLQIRVWQVIFIVFSHWPFKFLFCSSFCLYYSTSLGVKRISANVWYVNMSRIHHNSYYLKCPFCG